MVSLCFETKLSLAVLEEVWELRSVGSWFEGRMFDGGVLSVWNFTKE